MLSSTSFNSYGRQDTVHAIADRNSLGNVVEMFADFERRKLGTYISVLVCYCHITPSKSKSMSLF